MNKLAMAPWRMVPGLLVFAISTFAFSADLPGVEHRARVLVCTLDAPDIPIEKGALAAETIAAALEAGGLANALRPEYKVVKDWDQPLVATQTGNTQKGRSGQGNPDGFAPGVVSVPTATIKEVSRPDADFRIEGAVTRMGEGPGIKTWWVKADLYDEVTCEKLRTASASGLGDAGLLEASKAVAAELEKAYKLPVLEERTAAVRRSVEIGDFSRATALKRLDEMRQRWPDALPPVAVGLLLASKAKPADSQAVMQWGAWTTALLPDAGLAGKRFVLQLGIANPYELLAAAYDSAGKQDDAAAIRRQAQAEGWK